MFGGFCELYKLLGSANMILRQWLSFGWKWMQFFVCYLIFVCFS